MIRKDLHATRIESSGETRAGTMQFTASTSSPDRFSDVVAQSWALDAYERNPIILLNHDQFSLPIGRGKISSSDKGDLLIDIDFDMEDPKAAEVARKARAGFMNSVSVGFRPLKTTPRSELPADHYAAGEKGNFFERSELLEVSMVTLPANPEATARQYDQMESRLRSVVQEEIEKLIRVISFEKKHILKVEEFENEFLIAFAKAEKAEAEEDEEAEDEEEAGWTEDEEDTEDEESKSCPDAGLLSALVDAVRNENNIEVLSDEERSFFTHLTSYGVLI